MSLTALVYLPEAQSVEGALSPVAGLSVLLRLLLTATRAGVREIGLPRVLADESTLTRIRRHPGLAPAVFSPDGRALGPTPLLLLPAHAMVDPGSLRKLLVAGQSGGVVALEESKGRPAPLLVITAEQARVLWERLAAGVPIGEELEAQVRSGQVTWVAGGGYFVPVTDAGSRREAESTLFRNLGTGADSRVDRLVNRRCSRLLTRLLVRLPVTPNLVTLISLGFGLAAAWQFLNATPTSALLGLLFYMGAVVLDHSDGELARLTFQESKVGQVLDVTVDTLTTMLLVLGMAATASAVGGPLMLVLGALAACGVMLSSLLANFLLPHVDRPRRLGRVLLRLGTRDPFYLVLASFIFFLWKAPWLLPHLIGLLAAGSQAYWLTCLAQRRRAAR